MDPAILETATVAMATFFATIGPLDVAAVYAGLTATETPKRRRRMAIRGTLIGTGILVLFALVGEFLLAGLGISLAALRTGGGILLLLIGIDMVFARTSGSTSTTEEEEAEAMGKRDIAVFPLATPLIAGPGAMGAVILLTFIMLLLASKIQQLFGVTGMHVVTRVFGVLLSALAVQFIFDGIAQSGLLSGG